LPSRLVRILSGFKKSDAEGTIIVNGCRMINSSRNTRVEPQKFAFSTTAVTYTPTEVKFIHGKLPERILFVAIAPRLDLAVRKPAMNGAANFLCRFQRG
jgi:hypothetical protein